MSRFWSPIVHKLSPYVAGEQPRSCDVVKLNTNENPYGPSPRVLAAISAEVADTLRLFIPTLAPSSCGSRSPGDAASTRIRCLLETVPMKFSRIRFTRS